MKNLKDKTPCKASNCECVAEHQQTSIKSSVFSLEWIILLCSFWFQICNGWNRLLCGMDRFEHSLRSSGPRVPAKPQADGRPPRSFSPARRHTGTAGHTPRSTVPRGCPGPPSASADRSRQTHLFQILSRSPERGCPSGFHRRNVK